MEKTYNKKLFSFENYNALLEKIGAAEKAGDFDAKEDSTAVLKAFDSFFSYVQNVDMSEVQIKLAYARLEGADLRDRVEQYDRIRRAYHETAIVNCNLINRVAKFYEVGSIFLGSTTDRYEVADFCIEVTDIIFANRKR